MIEFSHYIPQNSRTIIFERFNDEEDLCTLLDGQQLGNALDAVDKKLLVNSFDEFKKKFHPTIYEVFTQNKDGNLEVTYSLKQPRANSSFNSISLCEHEFYRAVHDIAVEKSASNKDNDRISYDKLYETLNPKHIYDKARSRRKKVKQFVTNALEAWNNGDPDGADKWKKKARQIYREVKDEYSGSALRMLPLAVQDTEEILKSRGVKSGNIETIEDGNDAVELLPCSIKWDSEGNLKTVPLDQNQSEILGIEQKKEEQVLQITAKNWEATVDTMKEGTVDRNVFLSVYSGKANAVLAELSTEQLMERKKNLSDMYLAAQQSFCDVVGSLVQKVADVEQFFLHAGDEDKNGFVESGIIIANCSISETLEEENKENIKKFLEASRNSQKDRIWFAILPAAIHESEKEEKNWVKEKTINKTPDLFDSFDMDINDSESEELKNHDGMESVKVTDINKMSKFLSEHGILSFFNFCTCENTSFKNFGADSEIIEAYNEAASVIEKKEATVLAYPNFTIIPKNKRQVDMEVDGQKLYTPSIYIDAAYVAAGIIVASQNPKIQKKKFGKKVKEGNPFIRFDLEEEESCEKFITSFNPESRLNMDREVATRLRGKKGNAFCFRSDSLEQHAFVFTARTLNAKPIYWFITQQYYAFLLERMYKSRTSQNAKKFEKALNNVINNETDDTIVNQILRSGETFIFDEKENSFSLKFNGMDEPLDISIEIVNNAE